jgi:hypothetical protein
METTMIDDIDDEDRANIRSTSMAEVRAWAAAEVKLRERGVYPPLPEGGDADPQMPEAAPAKDHGAGTKKAG